MQPVAEYGEQVLQAEMHLGPYRLVKHLRQGGMASVYLGCHLKRKAYVALKVADGDTADLMLLRRETDFMQALQHEHIVPCVDAGRDGKYYYLVMPYLPEYIAPELFNGYVDVRSEVYSVGILLYQILTGSLPFDEPGNWKICLQHLESQPLAPSVLNPALPRPVERVILGALVKDPRRRYQTVEDLLCAFQKALDAPAFIGQLSSRWRTTCQKLRSRRCPLSDA